MEHFHSPPFLLCLLTYAVSECQVWGWWSLAGNSVGRWGGLAGSLNSPLLPLPPGAWRSSSTPRRCPRWNTSAAATPPRSSVWKLQRNAVSGRPVDCALSWRIEGAELHCRVRETGVWAFFTPVQMMQWCRRSSPCWLTQIWVGKGGTRHLALSLLLPAFSSEDAMVTVTCLKHPDD